MTHATATRDAERPPLPPGPPTNPLRQLWSLVSGPIATDGFLESLEGWFQEYGDVVHVSMLGRNLVFIRHPDDIHDLLLRRSESFQKGPDYTSQTIGLASFLGSGLLTSNGEQWQRQRKLVQPALHARRIEAYAATMVEQTRGLIDRWRDGQILPLHEAMSTLTMQIVASSLFSQDVSGEAATVSRALAVLQQMAVSPAVLLPAWLPTPFRRRQRRARAELDRIVYGFIEDWKAEGVDRGDLLSMLMLGPDGAGSGMDDKQVRDEVVTLLLAGHETTANALNWTFFLLAQNPEVESRLHAEVDRVLGARAATLADLPDLPYTKAVLEEAMRLYPPAWSFSRQAKEPVEVGGFSVPAGWEVEIITYSTHRDPRWWDAPETFRPERFLVEEPSRPRYAYLPFGGGARICIGLHFAMMEAHLVLATITRRFRLRLLPGQKVVPEPRITLFPRDGLPMQVEAR